MSTLATVPSVVHAIGAVLFFVALLHTFCAKLLHNLAHRYPSHSGLFHLLGEVEVVFGFWAFVLVLAMALWAGGGEAIAYAESRQYTEPLFVFVVMVVAASKPVLSVVKRTLSAISARIPLPTELVMAWSGLAIVPLMGSLITEPAAMTVAALMLAPRIFTSGTPERLKYAALGVLFVNVSIGGTLTAYAAPPVLMVAAAWHWDSAYMAAHFGWKAAIAVVLNATAMTWALRHNLTTAAQALDEESISTQDSDRVPWVVSLVHLAVLAGVVSLAHHPVLFLGLFLFFLGYVQAYARFQSPLVLKEGLLVGFFLAGLVVLGGMQQWWLQPLVASMTPNTLFFGATLLTAVTDNAALTYLGSLIEGLTPAAKYMLMAGAVTGGGLTLIANAPNPAGAALVRQGFQGQSIGAGGLLLGALLPTAVAAACFLLL